MSESSNTTLATILQREDGRQVSSLVLNQLGLDNLPKSQTACQVCPNALWLEQMVNDIPRPKVFCRIMNTIIWSDEEPVEITNCDGLLLSDEPLIEQPSEDLSKSGWTEEIPQVYQDEEMPEYSEQEFPS